MIDKIKKALEGIEHDINLDDLHIMPTADFNSLVEGYKTTIEETKVKSSKIGQEILLKELKADIGLDYERRKDPEELKKAYIAKFGAPEPSDNEDIKALQTKYAQDLADKDNKYDTLVSNHRSESDNKTILDSLRKDFAGFAEKTNYKTEDLVTIALSKSEFTVVDGKVFQSKDGEPVKNNFQPISSDSFANTMMLDGYIKKAEGGRVIGDETKGGKYSMEEFIASQEAQGVNVNGLEFSENAAAAQKAGTLEV